MHNLPESETEETSLTKSSPSKRRIILVCSGNTCRSPMAKVILEQKLKSLGRIDAFEIDSAAYDGATGGTATEKAKNTIERLYGEDLLASHRSKNLDNNLIQQADLILVMCAKMKKDLPAEKTYTLKEYAGEKGDIADPFGGEKDAYFKLATDIAYVTDKVVQRLLHFYEVSAMSSRSIPVTELAKMMQRKYRGTPYKQYVKEYEKARRVQKQKFGSGEGPSHPDPEMFPSKNPKQVIEWMALWQIEPYWDMNQKTGKRCVRFRSIPRKGGGGPFHVRNAVYDIPVYCKGLGLDVKDEKELRNMVASVQAEIRYKAGFDHAPFPTRYRP